MKTAKEILDSLTLDEKILLLTGSGSMSTYEIPEKGVKEVRMNDGPLGVRLESKIHGKTNAAHFPNLAALGATFNKELIMELGVSFGEDCIENDTDLILGPGTNIKRTPLCGRNFEYISEDPCLAGEIAAAYINGIQSTGVGVSLKHFALNNQEIYRQTSSSEIDERTMREIYLKPFEIAVKKSDPATVMCSYNKINSIWASENKFLLTDILRDEWGFGGVVVSDWCAVHNPCRAFSAGLDLQMPKNGEILEQLKKGLEDGSITIETIDRAALRVINLSLRLCPKKITYSRQKQHDMIRKADEEAIVLLKNDNETLPILPSKYKKVAIVGGYAENPVMGGFGSAQVYPQDEWIGNAVEILNKQNNGVEYVYRKFIAKDEYPEKFIWAMGGEYSEFIKDADLVVVFLGFKKGYDTEFFDKITTRLDPSDEYFLDEAAANGKKTVAVLQTGTSFIFGGIYKPLNEATDAIVEMWQGGESGLDAVCNILTGVVNPSGKLSETFPLKERKDIDYPGTPAYVCYDEKWKVGYRYYDLHPEEIMYPFGHGLSYTKFEYQNLKVKQSETSLNVELDVKNIGGRDGKEAVQIYVSDVKATYSRPLKELKAFEKVFVKKGETVHISVEINKSDLAYYNIMLKKWILESGEFKIMAAASSKDIRLEETVIINSDEPYTLNRFGSAMIG